MRLVIRDFKLNNFQKVFSVIPYKISKNLIKCTGVDKIISIQRVYSHNIFDVGTICEILI